MKQLRESCVCRDPNGAGMILVNSGDFVIGETRRVPFSMPVDDHLFPFVIEHREALRSSDPKPSAAVFNERPDIIIRQIEAARRVALKIRNAPIRSVLSRERI